MQKVAGAAILALSAASLAACATVPRPTYDASAAAAASVQVTYPGAQKYLADTRKWFLDRQDSNDSFDTVTKIGTGVGVGGGAINTIFKGAADSTLALLTGGALSYGLNQLYDPATRNGIYAAGLKNLDCVHNAGSDAWMADETAIRLLKDSKAQLKLASANISRDIAALRTAQGELPAEISNAGAQVQALTTQKKTQSNEYRAADNYLKALKGVQNPLSAAMDDAEDVLASAEAARLKIDLGVDTETAAEQAVGEHIIRAVDQTSEAVREQLRAKSPSLDAIAHAGSVFEPFVGAKGSYRTDLQNLALSVRPKDGSLQSGMGSKGDLLNRIGILEDKLNKDVKALKALLTQLTAQLNVADASAIDRCQVQFAADAGVTVSPSGPIDLDANATQLVIPSGKAPFQIRWANGAQPADLEVSPPNVTLDEFTLSAKSGAADKSYSFTVIDVQRHVSPAVTVNLHKAAAAPAPEKKDAPAPTTTTTPPTPPQPPQPADQ